MVSLKEEELKTSKETTLKLTEFRARATEAKIQEDIKTIKAYWANGIHDSATIKQKLNLNSKTYRIRLDRIAAEEVEHKAFTWLMFLHKKQLRYQTLRELKAGALERNNHNVALGCERLMNEIDDSIVNIGQKLGMVFTDPSTSVSLEGLSKKWMEMLGLPSNNGKNYIVTNPSLSAIKVSSVS